MKVELKKASLSDISIIRQLSETIWKKHYTSIISMEQIEYMLAKMYSVEQLSTEISSPAFSYYLVVVDGIVSGYISVSKDNALNYFLNKFYILQEQQFKGLGEKVFQLVFDNLRYSSIQLFVNRQNFKSVNFYFKMGFRIQDVVDNHIGDGYYMNDFIMLKKAD
jgi:diamine N-acetyltransferase